MRKWMNKKGILALALALIVTLALLCSGEAVQTMVNSKTENTLVIDAGHGGFDGGAVGASGTTEQDINLSIARRLAYLAEYFGVHTVLTRSDENALAYDPSRSVRENKIADIKAREEVVTQTQSPIFLSIHLNKFSDPQYHGAQVFYSPNHAGGRVLAELLQTSLVQGCDPENHRQAKQAESTIYVLKKLECPAVIVECGFLSNAEEEAKLNEFGYHKRLAGAILCGYLQYIDSV